MLSDLLCPDSVVVPLHTTSREIAISLLVEALDLPGSPADKNELKAAILAREAAGSTGIGNGVAIPHARTTRIAAPRLAIGRSAEPIDFKSADGKPVTLVFLLAVAAAEPASHLKVLAALSRLAADKKLLRLLNRAATPDELRSLVAGMGV